MPTQLEHSGEITFTQMPAAKVGRGISDLLEMELDIGEPSLGVAGDTVNAGQAPANTN